MCKCIEIEWRNDGLWYKSSCCGWKKVSGNQPSAITDGTSPPVIEPDDILNETPVQSANACSKANGFADLLFSVFNSFLQIRDDLTDGVNDGGVLAYLYWKGSEGAAPYGRYVYEEKIINQVMTGEKWLNSEDNIEEWFEGVAEIKQSFLCAARELMSPNPISTIEEFNLLKEIELVSGSVDLDDLWLAMMQHAIVPSEAVRIANQYVREGRGDCEVCNPVPPENPFSGLPAGCIKYILKQFTGYETPASVPVYGSYAGSTIAFQDTGFAAGDGRPIKAVGLLFQFSEPIEVHDFKFDAQTVSGSGEMREYAGGVRVSNDGVNWTTITSTYGSFISGGSVELGVNNIQAIAPGNWRYVWISAALRTYENIRANNIRAYVNHGGGTTVYFGQQHCI